MNSNEAARVSRHPFHKRKRTERAAVERKERKERKT